MGAPVFAIGLWWFVWTVPSLIQMHWMVPTASLVLVDYALNKFDTVLYVYLADNYLSYSASATAAVQFLRALLGVGVGNAGDGVCDRAGVFYLVWGEDKRGEPFCEVEFGM
ncbi:uncharacterized protein ATNIH1004_009587 [Aspergillus tanneri]|uniref:Uncharacterized protein n=1 Tax=Aspergillus tanneri TaxID=1220188 RepID=A0A5M9MC29_9EURO|nr:uncharacterized protein ATNIH1004_009587 [Aspergillus tanneri]KAA8642834.1 hypothetical protein ATNIH1004_009587 [Aspergillus tanneri]